MKRFKSYSEIIEHYRWNGRLKSIDEIEWIQKAAGMREAIELAGTSRQENGKLFFHQRWLDEEAAASGIRELLANVDDIAATQDFDLLFRFVDALVGGIGGLKEMFVYDIAFRIGAYKKVWPLRVYLHRGTREGAVVMGFDGDRRSIEVDEFPPEFGSLEPHEIESLLCTHKDDLAYVRMLMQQKRKGG